MAHLVHIDSAVLRDQSVIRRLTATGGGFENALCAIDQLRSAANWWPPTQRCLVADAIIAMGRGASIPS